MGPKRWIALGAVLTGAWLVIAVAPAYACPKFATNCFEQGDITMPANATGEQSTDIVPSGSTQGTELITPFTPEEAAAFDSNWETITAGYPKLASIKATPSGIFVRRAITCAIFARGASLSRSVLSFAVSDDETVASTDTSQLYLSMCLQVVYQTQKAIGSSVAHSASGKCSMAMVSIPIQIEHTASRVTARFHARPTKAGEPPLKVSCRTKGTGLQITMRPRPRRKRLGQVIGAHMGIGFSNPTSSPVKVHTLFTFS